MPSPMPSGGSPRGETESGELKVLVDEEVPLDIDLSECRHVADMRTAIAVAMNVHRVCLRLTAPGHRRCLEDDVPVTCLSKTSVVLLRPKPGIYVMDRLHSCIILWEIRPYLGKVVAGCDGAWNRPKSMFVDEAGSFYVSESGRHCVSRWDSLTEHTVVAGNSQGSALCQLDAPAGIFVTTDGDLYIAEIQNDRVTCWRRNNDMGELVVGGHGRGAGVQQLSGPQGVWLNSDGAVYVADTGNDRIMCKPAGTSDAEMVVRGHIIHNGEGGVLHAPTAVLVGSDDLIYVLDCRCHRVSRWQPGVEIGELVAGSFVAPQRQDSQLSMSADEFGHVRVTDLCKFCVDDKRPGAWHRGMTISGTIAIAMHVVYGGVFHSADAGIHHIIDAEGV
eukprot:CAMPEP_0204240694 /NCGR_PEP_ID=MMETSP0361-20130328/95012_1 /ASSEMBLY_ACC=CAM_ASM_000343 /TAXON_ID=268821 /ORGANISM="Scrippsiella Hangoei, Strain SHTV-5" /LENGTH=388 /DNA_ID=CAMNT_0051213497 /DNA_START=74 /DNA_END=1240 /DNA_ORIENTATION=+